MEIFTLYVGQGNFAVVVGQEEAIIVDSHIPPANDPHAEFLKHSLARIVAGKNVIGLMLTGFDADHADPECSQSPNLIPIHQLPRALRDGSHRGPHRRRRAKRAQMM